MPPISLIIPFLFNPSLLSHPSLPYLLEEGVEAGPIPSERIEKPPGVVSVLWRQRSFQADQL